MSNHNVLVLGSKPDSNLPDIEVSKIYTANGAAERADYYRKKYPTNKLTCICGAAEFSKNEHVSKRIINSRPERLLIRSGSIFFPKELENYTKLDCFTNLNQWKFQSNFFKYKSFSLFFAEFFHQTNYLKKIIHVLKSLKDRGLWGVSTGFYAILLALDENPESKIIISGIGMTGGKQFYKSERSKYFIYDSRARVDRFLINKLNIDYKNRLFSLDEELVNVANINKWTGKLL